MREHACTAQKIKEIPRVKYAQQKYTQLLTGNTPKYTNWAYFRLFRKIHRISTVSTAKMRFKK
jgi:hypothetical protein